jgi:hypothetical protein
MPLDACQLAEKHLSFLKGRFTNPDDAPWIIG